MLLKEMNKQPKLNKNTWKCLGYDIYVCILVNIFIDPFRIF